MSQAIEVSEVYSHYMASLSINGYNLKHSLPRWLLPWKFANRGLPWRPAICTINFATSKAWFERFGGWCGCTLPETNIIPREKWMVGILLVFLFGFRPIFRGYVSFREGNCWVSWRILFWLLRAELPNRQVPIIEFEDCRIPGTRQASCNHAASQVQEDGKLETAEQPEKLGWSCLKGLDMGTLQA